MLTSVFGRGGRARSHMKHRIQHPEYRIQNANAAGRTPAVATVAIPERWEKAVGTAVFSRIFSHLFPPLRSISHLFPPFPTSFLFYGQAERVGKWRVGLSQRWGGRSGKTRRAGGRIYAGKSA